MHTAGAPEDQDDEGDVDSSDGDDSSSGDDQPPALMPHEVTGHPQDNDNDDMPSLVTSDDSDGNSMPDLECDHESSGDSLPELDYDVENDGDSLRESESDHDEDDASDDVSGLSDYEDEDGDLQLPALVHFPAPAGAHPGLNSPLYLDQQSALDDLSHQLDVADALAASVRLVRAVPTKCCYLYLQCTPSFAYRASLMWWLAAL